MKTLKLSVAMLLCALAAQAQAASDLDACRSKIRSEYDYQSKSRWVKLTFDFRNFDKIQQCLVDRPLERLFGGSGMR